MTTLTTTADQTFGPRTDSRPLASTADTVISNKAIWAGRVLSGLTILFLLFDSIAKLLVLPPVVKGTVELGYPVSSIRGIGLALLVGVVLYALPRSAIFGAIVLTGYLGGAIATHVRVNNPLFSHVLFPIYMALFVWGGLWLRTPLLRTLIPLRRSPATR